MKTIQLVIKYFKILMPMVKELVYQLVFALKDKKITEDEAVQIANKVVVIGYAVAEIVGDENGKSKETENVDG